MRTLIILLSVSLFALPTAHAQAAAQGDLWRAFAERVDVGTRVRVRLNDGQRLTATLVQAAPDGLLVQPRTRLPVPFQRLPYERIASIERDDARGIGAGKAVAIGVASGTAAFLGLLLVIASTWD